MRAPCGLVLDRREHVVTEHAGTARVRARFKIGMINLGYNMCRLGQLKRMPDANAAGMQAFLGSFAKTIGKNEHAALVLDGAGWHS